MWKEERNKEFTSIMMMMFFLLCRYLSLVGRPTRLSLLFLANEFQRAKKTSEAKGKRKETKSRFRHTRHTALDPPRSRQLFALARRTKCCRTDIVLEMGGPRDLIHSLFPSFLLLNSYK